MNAELESLCTVSEKVYHCHILNYEITAKSAEDAAHVMRDLVQGSWPVVTVTEEQLEPEISNVDIDTEQYYPERDD